MAPDLSKLAPPAPFPALIAAARSNNIPLEGISPPGEAGSLTAGDSVTALITMSEKPGRRRQWLLYVEAAPPEAPKEDGVPAKHKSGKKGKGKHGWLGVGLRSLTTEETKELGFPSGTSAAFVSGVVPGSPAEKAGFKIGDVIVEFDGKKVEDDNQLKALIAATAPGTKVAIHLLRTEPGHEPVDQTLTATVDDQSASKFERSSAPASLRLIGPFVEPGAKTKAAKVEDHKEHITLNKGYLSLGLDQAAAAVYRVNQDEPKESASAAAKALAKKHTPKGAEEAKPPPFTDQEQRALEGSLMALGAYAELIQQTPGLDDLFFEIVDLPSVWSFVRHLGVKVDLDLLDDHLTPAEARTWNLPDQCACYNLPMALRINGHPALMATMVVTSPRPPLLTCAGIVGLLAEKPSDKQTYLSLRIISARCRVPEANPQDRQ